MSFTNPEDYFTNNLAGFFNILEFAKYKNIRRVHLASTSSVYGNQKPPFEEKSDTDKPISFYAATKKCDEIMAYSYFANFGISFNCLRFFTVYGTYGRPDMALFKFTKNILNNKKIDVYNKGIHKRDFTYVDDVVESIFKLYKKTKNQKNFYEIYNIGGGNPQTLMTYINTIENNIKKKSKKISYPYKEEM